MTAEGKIWNLGKWFVICFVLFCVSDDGDTDCICMLTETRQDITRPLFPVIGMVLSLLLLVFVLKSMHAIYNSQVLEAT